MSSDYEATLDENFKRALELCSTPTDSEYLYELLQNGNMPEKHFAAITIESVESKEQARILISNLTGCDGKIREAVAYKLSELTPRELEYFLEYPTIFADATIDINANICRTIIVVLKNFENDKIFVNSYLEKVSEFLTEALEAMDGFVFRDKKYTINKQLFKIYWCLEAVNLFFKSIDEDVFVQLIEKCSEIEEYTIREKVALILKNDTKSSTLLDLKDKLQNDSNYYVKNVQINNY